MSATELWPEQAAIAQQGRLHVAAGLIVWAPVAVGLGGLIVGPYSAIPGFVLTLVFGVAALVATTYQGWHFAKTDLGQPIPPFGLFMSRSIRRWWPFITILGISLIAPNRLTSLWMIPWTLLAVLGLLSTRYMAELWQWSGVVRPAGERLATAVANAAQRAGVEAPRAFELETHAINAVALPIRNIVIFTQRMVDVLDDDELEAIALHEIAHLNERRSVSRIRTLGILGYLPILAIKPLFGAGIIAVVLALLLVVAIARFVRRVSAVEETRADHVAVDSSHESHPLGTGLLKAHKAALIPSIVKGDTHGPLHERLMRAGIEPDFEPVEPKPRLGSLLVAVAFFFGLLVVVLIGVEIATDRWDGGTGTHVALALGWNEAEVLWYVGEVAAWDGDYDKAVLYLREAAAQEEYGALASLPWALGSAGRCGEVPGAYDDLVATDPTAEDLANAELWLEHCADLE